MPNDVDLLRAHCAGDPAAFAALVARHVDWAYAVARRRTGDPHAAEDVTQAAFLALAGRRMSAGTSKETSMAPWLFGVVRNLAAKSARAAARRRHHEAAAAAQRDTATKDDNGNAPPWPALVAALDESIAALPRGDAEAVLLRFYERRTHAEVGVALGLTEESARKRVARAVEKLREQFARSGLTPATLEAGLIAHVAPPAPAGLPATVTTRVGDAAARLVPPRRVGPVTAAITGGSLVGLTVIAGAVALLDRAGWPGQMPPTFVAAAAPVAASPGTQPTTVTLDELIRNVRASEQKIHTLAIRNYRTEFSAADTPDGPWRATPQVDTGSAWLDGRPGGKVRIDATQSVSPWTSGAAPYYVERKSASWDGTTGRVVMFAEGPIHKMDDRRVAVTASKRPSEVDYLGATGATYLANYVDHLNTEPSLTLSEAFEKLSRPGLALVERIGPPAVSEESVGGFDAVRLDWTLFNDTWTYWFARDRGYALVRFEHAVRVRRPPPSILPPELRYFSHFEVNTLTEAAPGTWVPTDATAVATHLGISKEHPWAYEQQHFRAEAVVVNDPALTLDIFRLAISTGFREETRK